MANKPDYKFDAFDAGWQSYICESLVGLDLMLAAHFLTSVHPDLFLTMHEVGAKRFLNRLVYRVTVDLKEDKNGVPVIKSATMG